MSLSDLRLLGRTGVRISPLALGAMNFGARGKTTRGRTRRRVPCSDPAATWSADARTIATGRACDATVGSPRRRKSAAGSPWVFLIGMVDLSCGTERGGPGRLRRVFRELTTRTVR